MLKKNRAMGIEDGLRKDLTSFVSSSLTSQVQVQQDISNLNQALSEKQPIGSYVSGISSNQNPKDVGVNNLYYSYETQTYTLVDASGKSAQLATKDDITSANLNIQNNINRLNNTTENYNDELTNYMQANDVQLAEEVQRAQKAEEAISSSLSGYVLKSDINSNISNIVSGNYISTSTSGAKDDVAGLQLYYSGNGQPVFVDAKQNQYGLVTSTMQQTLSSDIDNRLNNLNSSIQNVSVEVSKVHDYATEINNNEASRALAAETSLYNSLNNYVLKSDLGTNIFNTVSPSFISSSTSGAKDAVAGLQLYFSNDKGYPIFVDENKNSHVMATDHSLTILQDGLINLLNNEITRATNAETNINNSLGNYVLKSDLSNLSSSNSVSGIAPNTTDYTNAKSLYLTNISNIPVVSDSSNNSYQLATRDYVDYVGNSIAGSINTTSYVKNSPNSLTNFQFGVKRAQAIYSAKNTYGLVVDYQDGTSDRVLTAGGDLSSMRTGIGGQYPQIVGQDNTKNTVMQSFVASFSSPTSNGVYSITFPQAFASGCVPQVFFQIDFEMWAQNNVTRTVNLNEPNAINNASVSVIVSDASWSKFQTTNTSITALQVLAIGYM